jgi:hypothetical protein
MAKRKKAEGACNWCGSSYNSCSCMGWLAVKGIILIILAFALWWGYLNLESTLAIILLLWGLKCLFMPYFRK